MDLNASAVELELDRGLTAVFREDLLQILGHLGEHRFHRREQPQAAGSKAERSLEERDLRDEAEVAEEHVGGPNGLRVDARGIRDPFEHDTFVHTDPHLPEDIPEEDIAFFFGGPTEE